MLIVMKAGASRADVAGVEDKIRALGFTPNEIPGSTRLAIGITGNQGPLDPGMFTVMSGVADAVAVSKPWKLVSREVKPDDTFIDIGGARNVQNFSLLRRVAEAKKPVLLKRGMATSIQEWLLSAEYVLSGGNPNVILCERGIRTFETATRRSSEKFCTLRAPICRMSECSATRSTRSDSMTSVITGSPVSRRASSSSFSPSASRPWNA